MLLNGFALRLSTASLETLDFGVRRCATVPKSYDWQAFPAMLAGRLKDSQYAVVVEDNSLPLL